MYVLLPAMFGPVISRIVPSSGPSRVSLGTKSPGGRIASSTGCRPASTSKHRLGDDLGPAVALPDRQLGQRGQDVELGEHRAGLDQPRGLGRDAVAEGREELVFQLAGAVLGAEDLVLVLLELGRDVALGVLDRLLADVVGRDLAPLGLGVRDLDVVAEDLVEPDLEARDPGAADLLGLELGDPRLAALGDRPQLVELGMVARRGSGPLP